VIVPNVLGATRILLRRQHGPPRRATQLLSALPPQVLSFRVFEMPFTWLSLPLRRFRWCVRFARFSVTVQPDTNWTNDLFRAEQIREEESRHVWLLAP
jgi:hypothetical protein